MGRLRAKQDYENLRNARITRNKAIIESLGFSHNAGGIPAIVSSVKSIKRVKRSISVSATPIRRSDRLKGLKGPLGETKEYESPRNGEISENVDRMPSLQIISSSTKSGKRIKKSLPDLVTPLRRSARLKGETCKFDSSSPKDTLEEIGDHSELMQERSTDSCISEGEARTDDHVSGISDYESLRNALISENMARLASLGLDRSIRDLQDIFSAKSSAKTSKTIKKMKLDFMTPRRRSDRLMGKSADTDTSSSQVSSVERHEVSEKVRRGLFSNSDRCGSKGRGSIYDPMGICCHFCRQKKLCGEEHCKRCGVRDMNQPCIGKTECSVCHSTNGVLCRACLKVRYGEEMEEVKKKKDWMCPHCIEEKGINPYWICNSSLCLKKRKMVPTGIAIFQARKEGYESVAHMIMEELKHKAGCR